MKNLATTTALATAFALGIAGAPFAQGVNPTSPSSAAGGTMAQAQPGGQTGDRAGQPPAATGGQAQGETPGQTARTPGMPGQPGQTGAQPGQTPGMTGQTGQAPGMTGQTGQTPGMTGQTGQTPGMTGQTGQAPGMTGAPATPTTAEMSQDQIRSVLQARGYSDISGIERDGEHFKISEAKRFGRDVEDLRVNARTGQVEDEPRLNEDQARKLLEERGYSEVSDVERDGDHITAKAKRDGREVNLRINTETAVVMPQPSN
jgi:hypothetical protein